MKRTVLIVAILLALAGALWWTSRSETVAPPVLAQARIGTVTQTVLASGMLEARELVSVGARASGQIQTLAVKLGDSVKTGDLIAQIDNQNQQNTVLQAEAALAQINAQISAREAALVRDQLILDRQQALGKSNISAKGTVESAQADVAVDKADIEALKAQKSSAEVSVANARTELERTRITAPMDGTVVAVVVKQGQTVNAAQSAPTIVKIADLSTMLVKVEISEADVMAVHPGQTASFTTLGAPDDVFEATVAEIEPAPTEIADSDTISSDDAVYYNGLLQVANPEGRLRIGMNAEVSIRLAQASNVVTVPAAAVRTDAQGSYVETWDAATQARTRRPVTVGLNDKVTAEITAGLAEGDSVIAGAAVAPAAVTQGRRGPPPMF